MNFETLAVVVLADAITREDDDHRLYASYSDVRDAVEAAHKRLGLPMCTPAVRDALALTVMERNERRYVLALEDYRDDNYGREDAEERGDYELG